MWVWVALLIGTGLRGEYEAKVDETLIACEGFDLVAYIERGVFLKGRLEWQSAFQGLIYLFENEADLKVFDSAPRKYDFERIQKHLNGREYYFMNEQTVAIDGYDVVAYFSENGPQKGSPQFQSIYDGVNYFFVSASHRQKFEEDPLAYLPQFGGWCAFGLSLNPKGYGFPPGRYQPDPNHFIILDGRLFLFQKNEFVDGRVNWLGNPKQAYDRANAFWAPTPSLFQD